MKEKLSEDLKTVLSIARTKALGVNDDLLKLDHVLYAVLTTKNLVTDIVTKKLKNIEPLLNDILINIEKDSANLIDPEKDRVLLFDDVTVSILKTCTIDKPLEDSISVELFVLNALNNKYKNSFVLNTLNDKFGVSRKSLQVKLKHLIISEIQLPFDTNQDSYKEIKPIITKKTKTPIIDEFCRDLIVLANEDKLDAIIGREIEIERVAQILARKKKNNPILVGESGTGKSAIAEGLAILIANNNCPVALQGKRLVTLELTSLVAGTKYRGQFEERVKNLLDEIRENPEIIIFIDEIHTLIGTGNSTGSLDAANIFKPALSRGEIQCIGATTLKEYRESIEKDGALDRRFQKIIINPTTIKQTKEILLNIRDKYGDFHKVEYTDEAIEEIIRLSDRYITNREFPDKAIDVLDEAGARAQIDIKLPIKLKALEDQIKDIRLQKFDVVKTQNYEKAANLRDLEKTILSDIEKEREAWKSNINGKRKIITDTMICEVVSMMTNIPVTKISQNEIKKLLNIDNELSSTIIGQDDAIQKVSSAIKRNRTGIRKQNKPIASFIFVGASGVGKTQLAKNLAEKIFGGEDSMIRIDMSEYSEKFNISKLIGSAPGYIGYNEGGQLTEKVKNKPYSLILFDEIEKAHPDVFNVLLQILDEGHLTDSSGRKINFKNTIIIMTTNVGLTDIQNFGIKIGYSSNNNPDKNSNDIIEKALRKTFKPEFLNRIDELIFFNNLDTDNILKIVSLQIDELCDRLTESNYTLEITDDAKEYLAEIGYDKTYGAREIQRTIQKYLEDPISETLLEHNMPKSGHFKISYDKDENKIIVVLNDK